MEVAEKEKRPPRQDIAAALIPDALLTVQTVATLCGVHPQTISRWVRQGLFPPPATSASGRGGKGVRWRAEVVTHWLRHRAGVLE